ncbi:hypothetical protein TNCV_3516511 [Trichonephila clavipes]|nr:hypothetical protein TNCV_3516511 [Trichonephila clavipes]
MLDHLEDNIRRVIADIRPQMLENSSKTGHPDWTTSEFHGEITNSLFRPRKPPKEIIADTPPHGSDAKFLCFKGCKQIKIIFENEQSQNFLKIEWSQWLHLVRMLINNAQVNLTMNLLQYESEWASVYNVLLRSGVCV